jgi:hypothetical protein
MSSLNVSQRPRALAAESLVEGVLLALGLEVMLGQFDFEVINWPSLCVLLGLVILVVWVAQLLIGWEDLFQSVGAMQLPLGGMLHLWILVPYIGLVYLACRYQPNYAVVLTCITLIYVLDLFGAAIHWWRSTSEFVCTLNRNWVIRDICIFTPLLGIAWCLYFALERNDQQSPTGWSGLVFLVGMTIAYLSDMRMNRDFYGTHRLWRPLERVVGRLGKVLRRKRQ